MGVLFHFPLMMEVKHSFWRKSFWMIGRWGKQNRKSEETSQWFQGSWLAALGALWSVRIKSESNEEAL